jgi:hypothetical protein
LNDNEINSYTIEAGAGLYIVNISAGIMSFSEKVFVP